LTAETLYGMITTVKQFQEGGEKMLKKIRRNRKGFTLVELMTVVKDMILPQSCP